MVEFATVLVTVSVRVTVAVDGGSVMVCVVVSVIVWFLGSVTVSVIVLLWVTVTVPVLFVWWSCSSSLQVVLMLVVGMVTIAFPVRERKYSEESLLSLESNVTLSP